MYVTAYRCCMYAGLQCLMLSNLFEKNNTREKGHGELKLATSEKMRLLVSKPRICGESKMKS